MAADDNVDPGTVDPDHPTETQVLRARVVNRYRQGHTFEAIGRELGFTKQRAHKIYWDAMHAVERRAVNAHVAEMIDEISEVVRVANEVMHGSYFAHSNGKVAVHPETGQPLTDDAPRLDAARTIIAAHARMAKLLGADAPTRVEADVSGALRYEVVGIDPAGLT